MHCPVLPSILYRTSCQNTELPGTWQPYWSPFRMSFLPLSSLFLSRDLGVILNQELSFAEHISSLMRSCFYQLRQLRVVSLSLFHCYLSSCLYSQPTRLLLF